MNRGKVAVAALLALLLLAGCGSMQAGSGNPYRARIGVDTDGQVGQLRLLSVAIAAPDGRGSTHLAGDSAELFLTIANDGGAEDVLTAATSEAAQQVVFRNGDASPDPRLELSVPPAGVAVLRETTGPHLELSGLRETLHSGLSVPVTFRFRDAGSLSLEVRVRTYTDVRPTATLNPFAVTTR
jgi:periplasmic copper chaperone A